MNEWLNKTWVIRLISLVLAVITFIVISLDNQDTRTGDIGGFDSFFNSSQENQVLENIPVSIQIDDEEYVVSGVPQTVSVSMTGTVSVVQSTATQQNFNVFVDLEGLEAGTHTVPLEYEGMSSRLTVEIDPKEVNVLIERRATTEREVNVDFTNINSLQLGYELAQATVSPQVVRITSSENIVERISMVTVFVDVEGLGENMTFDNIPVRVYDHEGNQLNARIEPDVVSVAVELVSPNKSTPISIETTGQLPDGIRIVSIESNIEEVDVYAAEENLENIASIRTMPINLSGISETTTMDIGLEIPDTVRLLSDEMVSVTIEVEQWIEETIEEVAIELENLNSDFTSSFLNPETGHLDIVISGYQSDLVDISASDFQLSVDLEGLEDGEHELPITAVGPTGLEFSLGSEEVLIEVQ